MKYPVEVNAKWLVSVEAESTLEAARKVKQENYGAQVVPYNQTLMKTNIFIDSFQKCEMISYSELHKMAVNLLETEKDVKQAANNLHDAMQKVQRFRELLAEAEAKAQKAEENLDKVKAEYEEAKKHFCGPQTVSKEGT